MVGVKVDSESGEVRFHVWEVPVLGVMFKDPATITSEDVPPSLCTRNTNHGAIGPATLAMIRDAVSWMKRTHSIAYSSVEHNG